MTWRTGCGCGGSRIRHGRRGRLGAGGRDDIPDTELEPVRADALTAPGGELRVWYTPWHEERVLPALRDLLSLPFEHVLVSHGDPVHTRAGYDAALEREPWSDWDLP